MSPHMKGMFGAVVISQPELDIVTVVSKNALGQIIIIRFAIASRKNAAFQEGRFAVVAFKGQDFKNGDPREMGNAPTQIEAMAIRETVIADYIRTSDEVKRRSINVQYDTTPLLRPAIR